MDEKKVREAIEIMKNERPSCGEKIVYTEGEKCEAYDIAIEALEQTAEAGEMKITITQKLEEVRTDIVNIRHILLTEDTALDQAILCWKKGQLEKWAIFLEDLLSGGVKKSVGEDWKQNVMQRFGRVE